MNNKEAILILLLQLICLPPSSFGQTDTLPPDGGIDPRTRVAFERDQLDKAANKVRLNIQENRLDPKLMVSVMINQNPAIPRGMFNMKMNYLRNQLNQRLKNKEITLEQSQKIIDRVTPILQKRAGLTDPGSSSLVDGVVGLNSVVKKGFGFFKGFFDFFAEVDNAPFKKIADELDIVPFETMTQENINNAQAFTDNADEDDIDFLDQTGGIVIGDTSLRQDPESGDYLAPYPDENITDGTLDDAGLFDILEDENLSDKEKADIIRREAPIAIKDKAKTVNSKTDEATNEIEQGEQGLTLEETKEIAKNAAKFTKNAYYTAQTVNNILFLATGEQNRDVDNAMFVLGKTTSILAAYGTGNYFLAVAELSNLVVGIAGFNEDPGPSVSEQIQSLSNFLQSFSKTVFERFDIVDEKLEKIITQSNNILEEIANGRADLRQLQNYAVDVTLTLHNVQKDARLHAIELSKQNELVDWNQCVLWAENNIDIPMPLFEATRCVTLFTTWSNEVSRGGIFSGSRISSAVLPFDPHLNINRYKALLANDYGYGEWYGKNESIANPSEWYRGSRDLLTFLSTNPYIWDPDSRYALVNEFNVEVDASRGQLPLSRIPEILQETIKVGEKIEEKTKLITLRDREDESIGIIPFLVDRYRTDIISFQDSFTSSFNTFSRETYTDRTDEEEVRRTKLKGEGCEPCGGWRVKDPTTSQGFVYDINVWGGPYHQETQYIPQKLVDKSTHLGGQTFRFILSSPVWSILSENYDDRLYTNSMSYCGDVNADWNELAEGDIFGHSITVHEGGGTYAQYYTNRFNLRIPENILEIIPEEYKVAEAVGLGAVDLCVQKARFRDRDNNVVSSKSAMSSASGDSLWASYEIKGFFKLNENLEDERSRFLIMFDREYTYFLSSKSTYSSFSDISIRQRLINGWNAGNKDGFTRPERFVEINGTPLIDDFVESDNSDDTARFTTRRVEDQELADLIRLGNLLEVGFQNLRQRFLTEGRFLTTGGTNPAFGFDALSSIDGISTTTNMLEGMIALGLSKTLATEDKLGDLIPLEEETSQLPGNDRLWNGERIITAVKNSELPDSFIQQLFDFKAYNGPNFNLGFSQNIDSDIIDQFTLFSGDPSTGVQNYHPILINLSEDVGRKVRIGRNASTIVQYLGYSTFPEFNQSDILTRSIRSDFLPDRYFHFKVYALGDSSVIVSRKAEHELSIGRGDIKPYEIIEIIESDDDRLAFLDNGSVEYEQKNSIYARIDSADKRLNILLLNEDGFPGEPLAFVSDMLDDLRYAKGVIQGGFDNAKIWFNNKSPAALDIDPIQLATDFEWRLTIDNGFTDEDGDLLSFEVESADVNLLEISSIWANKVTVLPLKAGSTELIIRADDRRGGRVEKRVAVNIGDTTITDSTNTDSVRQFKKVWSGNPFLPMNVFVFSATLDGVPLEDTDEIAVIDGNHVVGAIKLSGNMMGTDPISITTSQQDGNTGIINGYTVNNPISFRLWDASSQREITSVQATYTDNDGNPIDPPRFTSQGTVVVRLTGSSTGAEQLIEFNRGWNLVSFYVKPTDTNIQSIYQPLIDEGSLEKIQAGGSGTLVRLLGTWRNTIGDLQTGQGYYVKVNEDTRLEIQGTVVPLPLNVGLNQGWNIMSYPRDSSEDALSFFQPLIDSEALEKVQAGGTGTLVRLLGTWRNTIGDLQAGQGYYVKVNRDIDFEIPNASVAKEVLSLAASIQAEPTHFQLRSYQTPYFPMNLFVDRESLEQAGFEEGDEIAVFDGELCVGSIRLYHKAEPYIELLAIADDPSTEIKEGFRQGSKVEWRAWQHRTNREIVLTSGISVLQTDLMETGQISVSFQRQGTLVAQLNADDLEQPIISSLESSSYPNPFNATTLIRYSLPEGAQIKLTIFNVLGQQVRRLVEGEYQSAGHYRLVWDGRTENEKLATSGLYFYRLEVKRIGESPEYLTRKMALLK